MFFTFQAMNTCIDTCCADEKLSDFIQRYISCSTVQSRGILHDVGIVRQSAVDFHTGYISAF